MAKLDRDYEIAQAYRDGPETAHWIRKHYHIGPTRLSRILTEYHIPLRGSGGSNKIQLSPERLEQMHQMYLGEIYTVDEIAIEFELSRTTVNRICQEQGWPQRRFAVRRHSGGALCCCCGMILEFGEIEFCSTCIDELVAGIVYTGDWVNEAERGPALDRLGQRVGQIVPAHLDIRSDFLAGTHGMQRVG